MLRKASKDESDLNVSDTSEEKKQGIIAGVLDVLKWTVVFITVGIAFFVIIVPFASGGTTKTVLTASMTPVIQPGDLVAIKPVNINDVKIGQVVEIQKESGKDETYIHRVISISLGSGGKKIITTRGDANKENDPPVTHPEQVRGVVMNLPGMDRLYIIPKLGYLKERPVLTLSVAAALILIGLGFAARRDRKEAREEMLMKERERAELEELRRLRREMDELDREELRRLREEKAARDSLTGDGSDGSTVAG